MEGLRSMYNITAQMITELRDLASVNNITLDNYTDEQLTTLINQSITVIGQSYVTGETCNEYDANYHNDIYLTGCYPIDVSSVEIKIDDTNINNDDIQNISNDGVIRFKKVLSGKLEVNYTNVLNTDIINQYIVLIALELFKTNNGGNVTSVHEGDVSVNYDNTTNLSASLDHLISEIHNNYGARVQLI